MTKACPVIVEPKRLLLDMALEKSLDGLLRLIVERLAASPSVCLARIWLIKPGAGCLTCPMRRECPDQTYCLQLVASAGQSRAVPPADYGRLDGEFRRFPIGVRKVGRIASEARAIEVPNLAEQPAWIANPAWLAAEGIQGFGGQPLINREEVLGVLAVFSRTNIGAVCLDWMRMIADHAAAAIANARAWEQIEALQRRLQQENEYLQEEVSATQSLGELIGQSPALLALARQIELVAPTDSSVLILGESGTGKELVAREIHQRSRRAERPLIKVNCAAIPRELFESEFFGHAKGAFTGAVRDRAGRFELAHGGTLFLDEIGETPLDLQSKLLRVLQEGELERVGEERTRRVDVRVIAATNRDLRKEVEQGRFRNDLYYRLGIFPIELSPLREHIEDIPLLAEHFLKSIARRLGRPLPRLTLGAVQRLQRYHWPGNVRELAHVLERAMIVSPSGRLELDVVLPRALLSESGAVSPSSGVRPHTAPQNERDDAILTEAELHDLETRNLARALRAAGGKISGPGGAAELLGVRPTTLASRLRKLGGTDALQEERPSQV